MNEDLQTILTIIHQSEHLSNEEKNTLLKAAKAAGKELEITASKLADTAKVNRTTAILLEDTVAELEQKRKTVAAQDRELEIESSLERVRTVALGMNKRDDMLLVCRVISEQLQHLDVKEVRNVQTAIFYEAKGTYINYEFYAKHDKAVVTEVNYKDHAVGKAFADRMMKGPNEIFTHCFKEKEVQDWYEYQKTTNVFIDTYLENASSLNYYWYSLGPVALGMSTYNPLSEEETSLFKRFLKVFELSYRRYLDIEKAEAQAREAQIELGLERIRARAMAMQKSDDLGRAVAIIFEELDKLNTGILRCGIGILNKENRSVNVWTTSKSDENTTVQISGDESMDSHPLLQGAFNAWLNQEEYSYVLHGKDLIDYYKAQAAANFKLPDSQSLLKANEDLFQYYFLATFQFGGLFAFRETAFPDEDKKVMKRFAGVFNLTYKRFLDLQKAEAQAREAQIEAALERVRTRSMGMQKSDELKEVIQVVYEQFVYLNILVEHTGFIMDYKERDDMHIWLADHQRVPSQVTIPYFDSPHWNSFNEAKEKGIDFFTNHLTFEEKNRFYQELFNHIPGVPEETREYYFSCPGLAVSTVLLEDIGLYIENYSGIAYSDEENATLMRFGKVFQQTYTRFLDLQKAEAQARESQIEAALERVRSRSMAMQKSDELTDVAGLLFAQVNALGIKTWTAGFNVWAEDNNSYVDYITSPAGGFVEPYTVYSHMTEVLTEVSSARKSGVEFLEQYAEGERLKETYLALSKCGDEKQYELMLEEGFQFPIHQYDHFVFGSKVSLMFITYDPVPESHDIFKRFGKVFEQTYTRFLDIQKAEAQALEAIKRASVDRVRAEIASMRTTSDLERITPLIWNELTMLDVPFIRCGVFIMDEDLQQVNTLLSNREGKAIAAFHQPFDTPGDIGEVIKTWRKKEVYRQHWNETQFNTFTKGLVEQGAITSGEKYLTENRPTDLYLHFLPFLQGMLYVGNTAPLDDGALQLVQNLADAFSTAYARYEDFNKLESANIKIERTLVDLKQAQSQLVQSEKMASLGELTAGIAHEIQNPLNFVNNFSELNKELLEELNEEIEKGNYKEAKIIAKDITGNEEKISYHGKRADAIVKGMLQHSRSSRATKEPTDINQLADEYLRLSYHGLRAKDNSSNATLKTGYDETIGTIHIIPQDIGRVLLNLYNNAFYTVNEKRHLQPSNGGATYEPIVTVSTKSIKLPAGDFGVSISVKDNGNGIPKKIVDKIFQPFFTTKPTGQGTGLGLSLSYDIVKAHGGEIKVETKESEGTEFTIYLPFKDNL